MRRTVQIKSEVLLTELQFTFGPKGSLVGFKIMNEEVEPDPRTVAKVLDNALTYPLLEQYCKTQNLKMVAVAQDLSFRAFWDAYNYKEGGSKKKAEDIWNRMPEHKRAAAIGYIPRYNAYLQRTQLAKAYATTYLNQERYDNA